jgi:hypothetical protein
MLLGVRRGRLLTVLRGIGVRGRDDARGAGRPLPEHRIVEAEKLADTAQRVLDLPVHFAGRQVDESRGEVGDQRFEFETAFDAVRENALPRSSPLGELYGGAGRNACSANPSTF